MPPQKATSGLMAKYGANLDKAVKAHAGDETTYGFTPLPPGIKAVCRVVKAEFKIYDADTKMKKADGSSAKGEYYYQMTGVIEEPEFHINDDGTKEKIAGRQTFSRNRPVFDTKDGKGNITTQEDHIAAILLDMRQVTSEDFTAGAGGAELENLAAAIQRDKPFFNFTTTYKDGTKNPDGTWKYQPGVWENWNGNRGLENYSPPSAESPAPAAKDESGKGGATPPPTQTAAPAPADDEPNWDDLIARADAGEEAAINDITDRATAIGIEIGPEKDAPPNTVNGSPDWTTVKTWIENGGAPELEDAKDAGGEWEPEVKGTVKHKPKGAKKQFDCAVVTVNKAKKTATIKNLTGGTVYKDVAWSDMEAA